MQAFLKYSVSRKKWAPQTFCTDKCKHASYWTKLSMHSPRSIWVIVAKFHTIPSYHLTDFQFLQIVVTDFSYRHDLLRMTHATYVTHDVILLINKMLSKEDRVLKGYGAKRLMTWISKKKLLACFREIMLTTRSGAFCKSESTVAGSVTSTIWNNDWLQNGADLTRTSKSESTVAGSVTSTIWNNDWLQNGADLTRTSLTVAGTTA